MKFDYLKEYRYEPIGLIGKFKDKKAFAEYIIEKSLVDDDTMKLVSDMTQLSTHFEGTFHSILVNAICSKIIELYEIEYFI